LESKVREIERQEMESVANTFELKEIGLEIPTKELESKKQALMEKMHSLEGRDRLGE
jgi:hypothetical protein